MKIIRKHKKIMSSVILHVPIIFFPFNYLTNAPRELVFAYISNSTYLEMRNH